MEAPLAIEGASLAAMGGDAIVRLGSTGASPTRYSVYSTRVVGTVVINLALMSGVVSMFACGVRSRFRRVSVCFDVRRRLSVEVDTEDINQAPPKDLSQLRVFFWPRTLRHSLELLRVAGLDGVVAMRFSMLCFHFVVFCAPVALMLCYVYHSGPHSQGKTDLQSVQMSNQRGPLVMFAANGAAWWISCVLMYLFHLEYKHFSLLRLLYFTGEHLELAAKRKRDRYQRTVFVERLPSYIDTHSKLRAAFEDLFGDEVERAVLCTDAAGLRQAVRLHEQLQLDREAMRSAGAGGCLSLLNVAFKYGGLRTLRLLRSADRPAQLASAEDGARRAYAAFASDVGEHDAEPQPLVLERSKTEEVMMLALRHHIQLHERDPSLPDIETPRRIQDAPARLSTVIHRNFDKQRCVRCDGRCVRCCDADFALLIEAGHRPSKGVVKAIGYALGRKGSESAGFVTFKSRACQAAAVQMTLYQSSKIVFASRAPFPNDVVWENLNMPEAQVRVRAFFSQLVMLAALILWSVIAALIQAIANLDLMHQRFQAMFPRLATALRVNTFFRWGRTRWWWAALEGYLPALALSLLLVALPPLVRAWARLYEGRKSWSGIMHTSVLTCFIFNQVTMYVTVFSGSILHSGFLGSGNPVEVTVRVIQGVVAQLDNVSGYLICYIFTKLGVRMAVYLCRPYAVLPWLVHSWIGDVLAALSRRADSASGGKSLLMPKDATEAVERHFLEEPPCYDWILTDLSIILALCTMYGIMSPALVLSALPFFFMYAAMVRYNIVFVYTQTYDSGGELFFSLFMTTFCALVLSLLLLQTYFFSFMRDVGSDALSSLGYVLWHLSIPSLIAFVVIVWRCIYRRYSPVCAALSLQLAKELDASAGSAASQEVMGAEYQDPVVSRARHVTGDARSDHEIWRRLVS